MQKQLSIDSLFESAKVLLNYVSVNRGYNIFIIDEIEIKDIIQLEEYIESGNKVEAVKLYRRLDRQIDNLRDTYCYNLLPERSSFRGIAKDLYRELKSTWLLYTDNFSYIGYILKFISTSDYYVIREFLAKRSYSMFNYKDIPLDPDSFYCGYVPIEAMLDYIIKYYSAYIKEYDKIPYI